MKPSAEVIGGLAVIRNPHEIEMEIRKDLTFSKDLYFEQVSQSLPCYKFLRRNGSKVALVPRIYPFAKSIPLEIKSSLGLAQEGIEVADHVKFSWSGVNQEKHIGAAVVRSKNNKIGGYFLAPCGSGKTLMGLEIARRLGRRTLIVVGREYQIQQWRQEAQKSFKNYTIGVYRAARRDRAENYQAVVGLINSLVKERGPEFFRGFGTVLFDECQHVPARTWLEFFSWLQSRYIIGLTAQLTRTDGLDTMFNWLIGGVLEKADVEEIQGGEVYQVYLPPSLNIRLPKAAPGRKLTRMQISKSLSRSETRTSMIGRVVHRLYGMGRDFYVFADIKKHLLAIRDAAVNFGVLRQDTGCFFANAKKAEREEALRRRVTFVTYSMASEGLNVPRKDAIVCGSPPVSNLRQLKGRISRVVPGKKSLLIIDPVDGGVSLLRGKAGWRCRQWQRQTEMEVRTFVWE